MTEAGTKQKKDLRYHSLDFWRGIACLSVAAFHSIDYVAENPAHVHGNALSHQIFVLLAQGWAGVPLFFVISGYCIAAACESGMEKGLTTKKYFFRRFRRIYPPYWILLLLLIGAHYLFLVCRGADYFADSIQPMKTPWEMSFPQWLGSFSLTEGWRDHLVGDQGHYFLQSAWSLGYEEQFYFVCGLAMLAGRKWFYKIMAWLSVVVFAIAFIHFVVKPLPIEGFFFDGDWLMFAAGVLVFYVLQFGNERSRKWAIALLAAAALLAIALDHHKHIYAVRQMPVSFLFGIVLIVLFKRDRQIASSTFLRPVTFCGIMCYSLYLIHMPIVKITSQFLYRAGLNGEWSTLFVTIPVSVLVSILAAWGFFSLVERRFLNTPPSYPTKPTTPKSVPQEMPVPVNA